MKHKYSKEWLQDTASSMKISFNEKAINEWISQAVPYYEVVITSNKDSKRINIIKPVIGSDIEHVNVLFVDCSFREAQRIANYLIKNI